MKNLKINSGIASCDFTNTNLENSSLEELLGGNSFSGTNLKNAVLIGCEDITLDLLRGANLEGCVLCSLIPKNIVDLAMSNLFKVDLEAIEWINANLNKCNFKNANLKDANLEGANLKDANLDEANLKNANLEGANLEGIRLKNSNLEGVTISEKDYVYLKNYIDKKKITLK